MCEEDGWLHSGCRQAQSLRGCLYDDRMLNASARAAWERSAQQNLGYTSA